MKRFTVGLPEDLSLRLEREAERRGTSISEVVRLCLAQMLHTGESRDVPWAGLVCEPEMAYGSRIDEALEEGWADAIVGDSR